MKKFLICLSLILLVSCAPAPTPSPPPKISGFTYYTNEEAGIEFQYPADWVDCDIDDLADPDFQQLIREQLKISADISENFKDTLVIMSDTESQSATFILRASDADGFDQKLLLNAETTDRIISQVAGQFADSFCNQFPEAGFAWIDQPAVKQFGACAFVVLSADITIGEIQQSAYQAMTANNDKIFLFTYSGETLDCIETIETMLSTVVLW